MTESGKAYDVIVLGAGAAGLMCAFIAAQRGRRVLVLEKANKVGKKILMSGGGRCNFTNYSVSAENYISGNPHFCKSALNRYTQWDFIALVAQHGIASEERNHGQLFCLHSAKDILSMLLEECECAGVEIKTHSSVSAVQAVEGESAGYLVRTDRDGKSQSYRAQSVVVATGALSIPTLGGSGFGYQVAEQFGLSLVERRAGLVPFMFSDGMKPICERLSGLALEVTVSCRQQSFTENLLFTHRGISGPVILQISNYWLPGDQVEVDLLPGIDARAWLVAEKGRAPKSKLRTLLQQHLAKGLIAELQALWWSQQANSPLAEISDRRLEEIGERLNAWMLKPSATEGYRTAEVTLGGVDTDGVSSKTLEAKSQKGLFFVGEVLDVTGHLGGYNFQWAWSSGYTAGMFA